MACTLFQGDCLTLLPNIPAASIHLILVDLPYGTTSNKWDSIIPLDTLWAQYRRVIKPGAPVVMFTQQPFTTTVVASNPRWLRTEWIWEKEQGTGFLNAKKYPLKSHENILVFCEKSPPYFPQMSPGKPYTTTRGNKSSTNYRPFAPTVTVNTGERYPTTVLRYAHDRPNSHPTQKPVALLEYLIKTYTQPGQVVLDNTMGAGSTGVAAMQTGRQFVGIEQDINYFAVAFDRIAKVQTDGPAVTSYIHR